MDWWLKWQSYTGFKKEDTPTGEVTPGGDEEKPTPALPIGSMELHPGFINTPEQILKLNNVEDPWLKHTSDDIMIRTSCKEDEDFILLPQPAWLLLKPIYGGLEVPRYPIEVATEDPQTDAGEKQYMVEVYYKKL